jgi:hypothetical protein
MEEEEGSPSRGLEAVAPLHLLPTTALTVTAMTTEQLAPASLCPPACIGRHLQCPPA